MIDVVAKHYDEQYLVDNLVALARTPTDVPLGQNEIEPTDPKITHYVHRVVRPMLEQLDAGTIDVDELNNLVFRIGPRDAAPCLFVMAYTTAQHGNYTDPALEGRIMSGRAHGVDEDCVFGKGTSQIKGALAAMLGAIRIVAAERVRMRGSLIFAVNAEGQSSHRCSMRIIDGHQVRADAGWLAIGTPKVVVGHRGRVDVYITITGEPGHSSQPLLAKNAMWGLHEALSRLKALKSSVAREDPDLGPEQVEPYKLTTSPIAPHTMPGEATLTVDRRLLPGTDADAAVEQIRDALGQIAPYEISVRKGVHHLPWKVSPDLPHVRALAAAHEAVRGRRPDVGYVRYAFDAGYANLRGIPTVMFGPTASTAGRTAGREVLATEFIPISAVRDFAKIYAHAMLSLIGGA